MRDSNSRVVVTGMGVVTPLGQSVREFWKSLVCGKSGIGPITLCDPSPFPCRIAGEVSDFDPNHYMDSRESRRMARFSQMAVAAAALALQDACLDTSKQVQERIGVVMGNGSGSLPTTEENARDLVHKGPMRMSPHFIPMILPNMASAHVSRLFGLKGYTSTIITACAAGTQAIGEATEAIRRGAADVLLAGGSEAGISQLGLGGFSIIKALTKFKGDPEKASRPFDATRDGFVAGEGSAVLVLESLAHAMDRGANVAVEVVGQGVSSDAFHAVQPDEDGSGAARAMRWALENADVGVGEIDYINAHGTSTPKNDLTETLAIKAQFGERAHKIPISSTKSMIGHGLGAAGALEAVVSVKTILEGVIHPTINYQYKDPLCDLDYVPNHSRRQRVDTVLSNSFGFGGQNACLVLRRFEE